MQGTLPTTDQLTDELFGFLTYLVKSAEHDVFRVAAELDLSLSQIRTLFVLGHADHALALHELADHVDLSVAAAGRAVDVLVRHGLVDRAEDADDRRVKRVALTTAGQDTLTRMAEARRDGLRRFVATLTEDERTRFSAALAPVLERGDVRALLAELGR